MKQTIVIVRSSCLISFFLLQDTVLRTVDCLLALPNWNYEGYLYVLIISSVTIHSYKSVVDALHLDNVKGYPVPFSCCTSPFLRIIF